MHWKRSIFLGQVLPETGEADTAAVLAVGIAYILFCDALFFGIHSYRVYLVHAATILELNRRLVAHFSFLPLYDLLLCIAVCLLSLLTARLIDSVLGSADTLFKVLFG